MKSTTVLVSVLLALAASGAQAHARLRGSAPQEGQTVPIMPASVSLIFSEPARVTAVWLQKDQQAKQTLAAPVTTGERISVEVPTLGAGSYTLSWRVASTDDNHIMSGALHFKVAAMKVDTLGTH